MSSSTALRSNCVLISCTLIIVILLIATFSMSFTLKNTNNHGEKEPIVNSHSEQVSVEFQNYIKERLGDESLPLSDEAEVIPSASTPCGATCAIFCEHGNVMDERGCPTCSCLPPPELQNLNLNR
ncbi:hypothetical protein C9374_004454 [Naegleria lovaniensis]|uniref:Antistasin-like domain-containing protein n=1 Tax=Naegleria lovaniensis TaxID=51637 RepID=A0AA88KJD3_NAELO|nr:uncharacterized protein C9374_004454 [Naegleria lovaniensis]KAG2383117.1 hypothetical protein C9374_004454 [Naegleria lovaniensis]